MKLTWAPGRGLSVALAGLLGCVRGAPRAAAPTAPEVSVAPPVESVFRERVRSLDEGLGTRGLRRVAVLGQGFLSAEGRRTTALRVESGRCVSIVTLGTTGFRDLDAHLYDPNGDVVVEDVETDTHPTVQLCASEARTLYHVVEAFDGQGAFVALAYEGPRASLDRVVEVVGGAPAMAGTRGAARSDIERRNNTLRDSLARAGFQQTGDPVVVQLSAGERVRLPRPVTPDRCYTLAALSEGNLDDVDLEVIDAAGAVVARSRSAARDAFVQFCPTLATTWFVDAIGVRGGPGGRALLTAYDVDASAAGVTALWLGERLDGSASGLSLDAAQPVLDARRVAAGFTQSVMAASTVNVIAGQVIERAVRVPAGRCVAVTGLGGRGMGRIAVSLYDGAARVAEGDSSGVGAAAVVCSLEALELRARWQPLTGAGAMLLRADASAEAFRPTAALVAGRPYLGRPGDELSLPEGTWSPGETQSFALAGGAVQRVSLRRDADACVRASVTAMRAGVPLRLAARRGDGTLITQNRGESAVALGLCGSDAEEVSLELAVEAPEHVNVSALLRTMRRQQAHTTWSIGSESGQAR